MIKEKNALVQSHFLQEEVQAPPEAPSPGAEFGFPVQEEPARASAQLVLGAHGHSLSFCA